MFINQIALWGSICLFMCVSIFFWIKWQKIGLPLLVLIITASCLHSFGIAKYSILGSMRLSSIPIVIDLEADLKPVSRGKDILNSLRSWSKILRGKKPIYISTGGSQVLVDPIGDDKSVKIFKLF